MLDSGWLLMYLCRVEPRSQRHRLLAKTSPYPQSPVPRTEPRRKGETKGERRKGSYEDLLALLKSPGARGARLALPGDSTGR